MSERNEPVDRRHEDALAAALHAQAESVRPAGDGLIRIRARVDRRRRLRSRLLVPLASTAAAAAAVTAVVASGVLAGSGTDKPSITALETTTAAPAVSKAKASFTRTTTPPPVVSVQPSVLASSAPVVITASQAVPVSVPASPSPSTFVAATRQPGATPVWPFADSDAAAAWQRTGSSSPDQWHLDARATAVAFVHSLKLPHMDLQGTAPIIAADGSATVDVFRIAASGARVTLGTVQLSRWGTGAAAPYGVVGVVSPAASQLPLAITSPAAGATVGAPLPVAFTLSGAEDDVIVSDWAAGASAPATTQQTSTGQAATVTLGSVPPAGPGFVVVADGNSGAGSWAISRLAVTPVTFGGGAAAADTYVALVGGRIHVYDVGSNAEVRTLAAQASGVTQVEVSDDRQWVYYLTSTSLSRTRLDGTGAPAVVLANPAGHHISSFGIAGPHAGQLAYASTDNNGAGQSLAWSDEGGASGSVLVSHSLPPEAGSVAISPDGKSLASTVKSGLQGNVEVISLPADQVYGSRTTTPAACDGTTGECIDATYTPQGDLVYVAANGQSLTVFRDHAGTASKLFTVSGVFGGTVDVDSTGTRVLLTDGGGHAWSWTSGTAKAAKALPGQITDASW